MRLQNQKMLVPKPIPEHLTKLNNNANPIVNLCA